MTVSSIGTGYDNPGPAVTVTPNPGLQLGATVPPLFPAASLSFGAIMDAYNKAVAAGSGIVLLPAGTLSLAGQGSLPVSSGIVYQGAGWTVKYTGIPDASNPTPAAGTWLTGDGTFPAFAGNSVDGTSAFSSQVGFSNAAITNCGIFNLGVSNFSHGAKIGSNYNPGPFYSKFDNICALASGWGWWFENSIHNEYGKVYALGNTLGGIRFRSSSTNAILQPGNCKARELVCTVPSASYLARGIVISCANGTNGGLSQASIIQSNRFGAATASQTATTNGTSTVAVSDTSKYMVGMPVAFTALGGATGLVLNQIYFVTGITANTSITIANQLFGTSLTPGAGSPTIVTQGMPCVEMVPDDSNASNNPSMYFIGLLDMEAGGTCKLAMQNLSIGCALTTSTQPGISTQDFCLRSTNVPVYIYTISAAVNLDTSDTNSNQVQVLGFNVGTNSIGPYSGLNGSGNKNLYLGSSSSFGQPTLKSVSPGNYDITYPGLVMCQTTSFGSANSFNLTSQYAGCFASTNSSSSSWTLPTITATLNGMPQEVPNQGSGVVTLNTAVGQGYNGTARTALTINSGASVSLRAVWTGSAGFWAVTGIGGTYSAGTISTI